MTPTDIIAEALLMVVVATTITGLIIITRRERKLCRDTMQMMGDMILGYERQLHNAMVLIKATNPTEALKADSDKKSFDLKIKYLEDALAQAKDDLKKNEPKFVTTADGRKFDVKELEVF